MTAKSMTLNKSEGSASSDEAEKFVKWASSFPDVEANIVYDYITTGSVEHGNLKSERGAFNGVTLQWGHGWDLDHTGFSAEEPGELQRVSTGAVHVRPGGVATATSDGFDVVNLPVMIEVIGADGKPVLDANGVVQMREVDA